MTFGEMTLWRGQASRRFLGTRATGTPYNGSMDVEADIVRALYDFVAGHPLFGSATAFVANQGPILLGLTVLIGLAWPGIDAGRRLQILATVLLSAAFAFSLGLLLEHLLSRPRPFVALNLTPLFPHATDSSFPSDHALVGVALALPLLLWRRAFGTTALIVALLVGTARIGAGVHYPSDILGSALLGAVIGLSVAWAVRAVAERLNDPFELD